MTRQKFLFNLIGFNLIWAALVIIREPWTQALALGFIAIHFLWLATAGESRRVASLMLIGAVIDGLLTRQGWFIFTPAVPWLPAWLILLWACFACTLEHSLRWSLTRWPLAAALGAVAGPLSYFAGERFGAVSFGNDALATFGLLSLIWACILGSIAVIYRRLGCLTDR